MKDSAKLCVCGLGTVGLPTAQYIQRQGLFEICGYDIKNIKSEIKMYTKWDKIPPTDLYVITVNTKSVSNICRKIAERNKNVLICIESTVPVGTCRSLSKRYGLNLMVHCPHRFWKEAPKKHGVQQLRVLGALNTFSLVKGKQFYKRLNIPIHIVPTLEVAEASKIVENNYRYVQIAFVEELYRICDKFNLDFDAVREAVNTKWNTRLLEARGGIKGNCLPKDIDYLRYLGLYEVFKTPLLDGAVETDKMYRRMVEGKNE